MEVNRKSALCKIKCKGFFAHSHLFSDAARQKRMPQKMSPNADAVSGYGPAGNGNRVGGKHSSSTEKSPLRKKYLPPHTQHHKSSGIYSYFFRDTYIISIKMEATKKSYYKYVLMMMMWMDLNLNVDGETK